MEDKTMNAQKIKTMLNNEILNQSKDKGATDVLKGILFGSDNVIDWEKAYDLIMLFMPELAKYDGYKEENME